MVGIGLGLEDISIIFIYTRVRGARITYFLGGMKCTTKIFYSLIINFKDFTAAQQ
jgi:hypothetical protein